MLFRSADRGRVVQVMFTLHEKVISLTLLGGDEPDPDYFKQLSLRGQTVNRQFARFDSDIISLTKEKKNHTNSA